jgi:2-dehydro-3-deoxygluconokinase
LLVNEEDLQLGLGIEGQDVESSSKLDTNAFFGMIERVTSEFPNIQAVAITLREVQTSNRHQWGSVVWCQGEQSVSPVRELGVIDRIGGGDGFATGLIYGFLDGRSLDETLRLGWAHGTVLTTFPGDTAMVRLSEVEAFAKGGSARVQR